MLTIKYPVLMNVPKLNQYEIEEMRTTLSQTKEEIFDGVLWEEEPEFPTDGCWFLPHVKSLPSQRGSRLRGSLPFFQV